MEADSTGCPDYSELRVIVVDDSLTARKFMKEILTNLGCREVLEAKQGKAALEQLRAGIFDLVVSDWEMPEMDGLELLKEVRDQLRTRHLPFLMVTSHGDKDAVMKAMLEGASDFIVKPFTTETVEEKLRKFFSKK